MFIVFDFKQIIPRKLLDMQAYENHCFSYKTLHLAGEQKVWSKEVNNLQRE